MLYISNAYREIYMVDLICTGCCSVTMDEVGLNKEQFLSGVQFRMVHTGMQQSGNTWMII